MSADSLKLYQSNLSPNSRRVRVFLAEKGVSLPMVLVDLGAKEQFSDAYGAINSRRMVPALVLSDGTLIAEVPVILRYLEDIFPEPPLFGATAKERAVVAMWERRAELEGFAAVMEAVRNTVAGLKGRALAGPHFYEQIPALAERSIQRVKDFQFDLDVRLKDVDYVAGEHLSAADITALVALDFAKDGLQLPIPDNYHHLQRWYGQVSARPAMNA